ncbi:MAG: peptidase, partial [Xanthomonadales bacterium]|nr:peptidase [Xanthomonadales bacterium]
AANAATITIVNIDGANEGFNDPTPVAPLPSNPATTLGAQRLAVFQVAAAQWGALLQSDVEIRVRAAFNPLTCSGTSAVLGSAGATTVHSDFTNAPLPNTQYAAALANALSGMDLNGANEEINSQFNVSLDTGTCLTGTAGWYYSTSDTDPPPADRTPLLPVVFHELGHGLGFQTFTSNQTGAFLGGVPDIWTNFLFDLEVMQSWRDMPSNATRQASAINDPNLVWTGPNVTADQSLFLGTPPALVIATPAAIAGTYAAQSAAFGPTVPLAGVSGSIVAADDGTAPSTTDGCEAFTNGAQIAGNIALVDRGNCNFTVKVANAQAVGAIAVLVANNAATGLPPMGGVDPTITIPSYGILQATGNDIRAQLAMPVAVTGSLSYDNTTLAGTNGGFVRMNAPDPVVPGSSVSHWTPDTFPNLLMEPSLNTSLFDEVDLTTALFKDIGWTILANDGLFADGFE